MVKLQKYIEKIDSTLCSCQPKEVLSLSFNFFWSVYFPVKSES